MKEKKEQLLSKFGMTRKRAKGGIILMTKFGIEKHRKFPSISIKADA